MAKFGNRTTGSVEERILDVSEELIKAYASGSSADMVRENMVRVIEKHGGVVLGRGQNRIGFTLDNYETCFKVAYRAIGFRDNYLEKSYYDLISGEANVYKALNKYVPEVSTFTVGGELENFLIQMEYIEDLKTKSGSYSTDEEAATIALLENSDMAAKTIDAWSEYFWIADAHPTSASLNYGNKGGNIAIRDFGYFVPRIGDLASMTNNVDGVECELVYHNVFRELKGSTNQKIDTLNTLAESYNYRDSDGNIYDRQEDAHDIAEQAMVAYLAEMM